MDRKSESIANLAAALALAQGQMEAAQINSVNPFLKNRYADLGAVIKAIRGPFAANGLAVTQLVSTEDNRITVTTMLVHASGEWLADEMTMIVSTDKGLSFAQSCGVLITYMRRYMLAAIAGVYAEEDADGTDPKGAAVGTGAKKPAPPKPAEDKNSAPPKPAQTAPPSKKKREFFPPEVLKEKLNASAASKEIEKNPDDYREAVCYSMMGVITPDSEDGNAVQFEEIIHFLTGTNFESLSAAWVDTLYHWLNPAIIFDVTGNSFWMPDDLAIAEVQALIEHIETFGSPKA